MVTWQVSDEDLDPYLTGSNNDKPDKQQFFLALRVLLKMYWLLGIFTNVLGT